MKLRIAIVFSLLLGALTFTSAKAQGPADSTRRPPPGNMLAMFEHPKNLKVLPKSISPSDLQTAMRTFSRSLGVRCGFCHTALKPENDKPPKLDFVSDAKPEKRNTRKMLVMVQDINHKYLKKMDKSFEQLTCVSCHHGSPKPMVSVDSLPAPVKR
jgi:thioredoxin-related protein